MSDRDRGTPGARASTRPAKPLATAWSEVPERQAGAIADRLLLGNHGADGLVRRARLNLSAGRRDLAERNLRKAFAFIAAIRRLGYVCVALEDKATTLADELGLTRAAE